MPIKSVSEAIKEAHAQILNENDNAFVMGEGLGDAKRAFGTVPNHARVYDMPVSENGMTGVCIGAAISGMRPIMVHMRADFLLYAADQIINNAAKWWAMFGGKGGNCPLVIRAIIGRGWGQGMQHSQHLENIFAQIPGLTVIAPSNAYDAKGMLIWASRQKNPVIYFEHRWIHELKAEVPDEMYEVLPRGVCVNTAPKGSRLVRTYGYLVHEAVAASKHSDIEVWDMRGPIGANWVEKSCCPPSPALSKGFYPTAQDLGAPPADLPHDIPNENFRGPF